MPVIQSAKIISLCNTENMNCKSCGSPFEKTRKDHVYCSRKNCLSGRRSTLQKDKTAEVHRLEEIERQKRIKEQIMIFRLVITDLNSSPDAMRELVGLEPLEIKEAMTISEFYGKGVNHIYENLELL